MVATSLEEENRTTSVGKEHERFVDNVKDKSFDKNVATEPMLHSWMIVAAGSVVPLGVAIAAAVTTYITSSERVGITAWVAVAVVGAASVISTAVASRKRVKSVSRDDEGERVVSTSNEVSRVKPK